MTSYNLDYFDQHLDSGYVRFHKPRYAKFFKVFFEYYTSGQSVLDIGSSFLTDALRSSIGSVDTLGFGIDQIKTVNSNYHFDLNDARERSIWRADIPQYDNIIFCEVIEHLYTSPHQVLNFLSTCLKSQGLIFIQTPNAVALNKRLKMLIGKNPFELIRENYKNPGHFREYTSKELMSYLTNAGLEVEHLSYENYFDFQYSDHIGGVVNRDKKRILLNIVYKLLPGGLKPGLFIIARKVK